MGTGRNRNAPCWCGSGAKYKKCHLEREKQAPDNPWKSVEKNKKAFSRKTCWANNVGLGECDGRIISAHTISKGANLSSIANQSHVLKYTADVASMNKTGGSLSVNRVGTSQASVFTGFCAKHDRELFSCVENSSFTAKPDQCLAIAYRTMSWERYGKEAMSHLRETLRGSDKGRSKLEQKAIQTILDLVHRGNEASRREIGHCHDKLTAALASRDSSKLGLYIIETESRLPFVFAGGWTPLTDLFNRHLQDGESADLLQQMVFYTYCGDNFDYICISWFNDEAEIGKEIAKQIDSFDHRQKIIVSLYLALRQTENLFFNEEWCNALSADQRRILDHLAEEGIKFTDKSLPIEAVLEIGFSLPAASRSYFI
jgi:hypothetical protein